MHSPDPDPAPPRLPKPPTVPQSVTHVRLGTARAFHSGRPVSQNMVDNVLPQGHWEAEWDVKVKKARRIRRLAKNKQVPKSEQMLKAHPRPLVAEAQSESQSEFSVYFPVATLAPLPTLCSELSSSERDEFDSYQA